MKSNHNVVFPLSALVSDEVNYNKEITMNKILMKVCEWLMAATQCLKLKGDGGEAKQQSCNEKDGKTKKTTGGSLRLRYRLRQAKALR